MMVAGEASGDLHGAGVVRELKKRFPKVEIFGIGGIAMQKEGMELLYDVRDLSVMGFVEVLRHLPLIRKVGRALERCLDEREPQVVVLIDYPGFNLRFAKKIKERHVKILYYIGPQVWAWNKGRIKQIKRYVDQVNVILPFEADLYAKEDVAVEFVGHPLLEKLTTQLSRDEFFSRFNLNPAGKILALLPGSRAQEVRGILPTMLSTAKLLHDRCKTQTVVGIAPGLSRELFESLTRNEEVVLVEQATYALMQHADAAIVTSGTATLETALFGTPFIVVYRTSSLTFFIGKLLVRVPHIGLVNIVSGARIIPEFIQHRMTVPNLVDELEKMLLDPSYASQIRRDLAVVKTKLGQPGASSRVAENVINLALAA
jgi:lipid-A-disaccharide synthase